MIPAQNGEVQSNNSADPLCEAEDVFAIWYDDAGSSLEEDIRIKMSNYLNDIFECVLIRNRKRHFFKLLYNLPAGTEIFLIITSRKVQYFHSFAVKNVKYKQIYMFPWTIPTDSHLRTFTNVDELFERISSEKKAYQKQRQASAVSDSPASHRRMSDCTPLWNICDMKLTESCCQYWRKRSSHFFLSQALNKTLTRMKCSYWPSFAEMIEACRSFCIDRQVPLVNIEEMKKNYPSKDPVWYYTAASPIFRSIGQAFRLQHFDKIYKLRRFIFDLHTQIKNLAQENNCVIGEPCFYRGKKLHLFQIQQFQDYIGCLISWNGFLSTTHSLETARKLFAGVETNRPNHASVVFKFYVDEKTIDRVYADVSSYSQFEAEEEVLFTIGSLWRILTVDPISGGPNSHWTIKLAACSESDSELRRYLTDFPDDSALHMIGDILRDLGRHKEAEKLYHKILLEGEISVETRATLLNNIAMIYKAQGQHPQAIRYFHKANNLLKTMVVRTDLLTPLPLYSASDTASPIHLLNNIALSYQEMDNSEQADKCYREALQIENTSSADKATVNRNLARLLLRNGRYSEAMEHIDTAVKLAEDSSLLIIFKRERAYIETCLNSYTNSPVEEYAWF